MLFSYHSCFNTYYCVNNKQLTLLLIHDHTNVIKKTTFDTFYYIPYYTLIQVMIQSLIFLPRCCPHYRPDLWSSCEDLLVIALLYLWGFYLYYRVDCKTAVPKKKTLYTDTHGVSASFLFHFWPPEYNEGKHLEIVFY